MIFFVGNDGTVISSVPSPVYQGSANANDIYVVAPFAVNLQATVAFKLPNGVWTERFLMTQTNEIKGVINEKTGKPYIGWRFSLPNEITQYYGTVMAQFFFYAGQSIVATSGTSFTVGRGVPAVLPATPTEDVYEQILSNLSTLQQQLNNGTYAAKSIYAWNSTYTYGANELVYYPNEGAFGVFLKSLIANNTYNPYEGGILNTKYWKIITDFNLLEEITHLKTDVEQAVLAAERSAGLAEQSADTATTQATAAAKSASSAEKSAQRVENAAEYLESVQIGEIAVPKAIGDDNGKNIAEHFEDIEELIPSTTTPENQLADKAFVNSSINAMAAFYITQNAEGDAFSTRADLLSATNFYSGGKERVLTQNDYAIVLSDESQPKGVDDNYPTTRYSYQGGTYPDGQWDFQYVVNNTSLTQAQVDAINSGITKEIVDTIGKGTVTGVKGNAETEYRVGNVNLTPENIGAVNKEGDSMTGELRVVGSVRATIFSPLVRSAEWIDFVVGNKNFGLVGENGTVYRLNELVQKSGDTMTGELIIKDGDQSYNVRGYYNDAPTLRYNDSFKSGFYGSSFAQYDKCFVCGEGDDKAVIQYNYEDGWHLRVSNNGNEFMNQRFIDNSGSLYDQGQKVYSPNNKQPIVTNFGAVQKITSNQTLPAVSVGEVGFAGYTTTFSITYTIYAPSSGSYTVLYHISNPYFNGDNQYYSYANARQVSGGSAVAAVQGNGKPTAISIIYYRVS